MDSEFNNRPGINLPPPVPEMPSAAATMSEQSPSAPVEAAPNMEQGSLRPAPAITAPPAVSLPVPPAAPVVPSDVSTTTFAVPTTADDADLIEKEWVNKAKEIVERTREDPHKQSKEMTLFKAEYMQKRYNKVLKVSE